MLRIGAFDYLVNIAGPGERMELFLQGCYQMCPDCFNPSLHDPKGGREFTNQMIIDDIKANCPNKLLTIGGGEPLFQMLDLCFFLEQLRLEIPDIHVLLYTSYEYKLIQEIINQSESCDHILVNSIMSQEEQAEILKRILLNINILVDGAFQKDLVLPRTSGLFIGSKNQNVIEFKNGTEISNLSAVKYYKKVGIKVPKRRVKING